MGSGRQDVHAKRNRAFWQSGMLAIGVLVVALGGCSRQPKLTGKVLHIPLKDNVKTSDPTNVYDVVSGEVVEQIYEGLYEYDYFREGAVLKPLLAASMPKVSVDGKTYTIRLRKGLRFQDDPCFKATNGKGREVTAADFLYGWKRHANPGNESQAFWIWDGKVAGINDFQKKFGQGRSAAEVMKDEVEGFRALDNRTIQIRLVKPFPQLVYLLAIHFAAPIPQEAIEHYGKDFVNHPVGTGPFKALRWNPTSQIILVKNENYRDEHFPSAEALGPRYRHLAKFAGRKLPLADAIDFAVVKEEQPRWLGFLSGKFDQIEIPKDNFNSAVLDGKVHPDLAKKGMILSTEPAYILLYVTFNMKDPVVGTNKYLRQAIASALDAKTWLHLFKNDRGAVQTEVNPPAIKDRCGNSYRWAYNVKRAKDLMAKAGFPEGKGLAPLRWDTRGPELAERQLAEYVAKTLATIGIKLEINTNTFPAYLEKMNKGLLQVSKSYWSMDYPDAENNMQLLYGPNRSPGPNDANFDDAEYNRLYEKLAVAPSGPVRREILCKMEEIIQEHAPWAYVMYEDEYRLVQPWVDTYHTAELVMNKYRFVDTRAVDAADKAPVVSSR